MTLSRFPAKELMLGKNANSFRKYADANRIADALRNRAHRTRLCRDDHAGIVLVCRTVNFEKSFADFGEPFLRECEVLMQTVFENVSDDREIEIVPESAGKPFRFVRVVRLRRTGNTMESAIQRLNAKTDGAREFRMRD